MNNNTNGFMGIITEDTLKLEQDIIIICEQHFEDLLNKHNEKWK